MGFGGFQPSFCRNIYRNFYKMKGKTDQERMKNAGVPAVYLRGCKKASFLQPLKKADLCVPAIEQVRNEICPFGQVKSLCGEIFAPQM